MSKYSARCGCWGVCNWALKHNKTTASNITSFKRRNPEQKRLEFWHNCTQQHPLPLGSQRKTPAELWVRTLDSCSFKPDFRKSTTKTAVSLFWLKETKTRTNKRCSTSLHTLIVALEAVVVLLVFFPFTLKAVCSIAVITATFAAVADAEAGVDERQRIHTQNFMDLPKSQQPQSKLGT